ncbi:hypothetical protein RFN57_04085 [Streptomyces violaceochromogenes]|uniref:Uncharacterized protein n=1 Tax=Streptomyces violaceochromogenes TaxID=67377 RepID=A0ABU6LPP7_9ACTN|nr:hypothetical protein [Streptomyces violaceochromogenes]MEC7051469.1 hypothetical protein [Streptomyces violaceochromogenes]GHC90769.1 hypothetical protein GCM10010309_72940 [Streptomyces violaceochromogenes]
MLLWSMAEPGWPSIFEVDDLLLAREVARDPEGFKRPSSLVPTRIRDLARYDIVTGAGCVSVGIRHPTSPWSLRISQVPRRGPQPFVDSLGRHDMHEPLK